VDLRIAIIKGDGIGPEVVDEALKVLTAVGARYGHRFRCDELEAGGAAIDRKGMPLPQTTLHGCLAADAVLLGAVGGPKWDHLKGEERPEAALLGLRKSLRLYTNIRPIALSPSLTGASPLKRELAEQGIDMVMVRELTSGIYFGAKGRRHTSHGEEAFDTERYNEEEIVRVARSAFNLARKRRSKVTSIDKANVLASSRLWRDTVCSLATDYPDIMLEHMLVDNAAMQLVKNPSRFDVILTSNMFGDILSDEAAVLTGSIGCLPSASVGDATLGLYEPIHGSAPDIAGKNIANPIGTILAMALMLRYSCLMAQEATAVENAVEQALKKGYRTADIMEPGGFEVNTCQMGDFITKEI
jgi:3-isopropylmalate dehydrogenase